MNISDKEQVKVCLRQEMKQKRKALLPEEVQSLSQKASDILLASPFWHDSDRILLYAGIHGEVDTTNLFARAIEQGKKVGMPRCLSKEGAMLFAECSCKEQLASGYFGLYEPLVDRPILELTNTTLAVLPGIAFTRQGARLGQGGGYYDRFFAQEAAQSMCRVGLCYTFQIVASLPVEPWDIPVDAICSDEEIIFCNK